MRHNSLGLGILTKKERAEDILWTIIVMRVVPSLGQFIT